MPLFDPPAHGPHVIILITETTNKKDEAPATDDANEEVSTVEDKAQEELFAQEATASAPNALRALQQRQKPQRRQL